MMALELSTLSPYAVMRYACGIFLGVGVAVFVRSLLKRDRAYELLVPWGLRLFLYSVTFAVVPPAGLMLGLGISLLGKNREMRKFARGALLVSVAFLVLHLSIYFDASS
jgi:hypothetical protein